jgi:hypothetical protein
MNIDTIFSGDLGSIGTLLSRHDFRVVVSGAAAVPSAFGGKAHTCYSLDVSLRFAKGQGAVMPILERSECGRELRGSLELQYNLLRRFSDVKALHAALKVEFARSATKMCVRIRLPDHFASHFLQT